MTSFEAVQQRILQIPHLDLQMTFDLERLQAEAASITEYVPYRAMYAAEPVKQMYAEAWGGRALLDYDGDSRKGMQEFTPQEIQRLRAEKLQPRPTEIADQCPCIMDTVMALSGDKHRARVMCIRGGKSLVWHSHVREFRQPTSQLTVHVPIVMPPDFTYNVVHPSKLNAGRPALVDQHVARYATGRATYFNSYHYHNVYNPNAVDRISLMLYLRLEDPDVFRMVSRAIDMYDGPLLPA